MASEQTMCSGIDYHSKNHQSESQSTDRASADSYRLLDKSKLLKLILRLFNRVKTCVGIILAKKSYRS